MEPRSQQIKTLCCQCFKFECARYLAMRYGVSIDFRCMQVRRHQGKRHFPQGEEGLGYSSKLTYDARPQKTYAHLTKLVYV